MTTTAATETRTAPCGCQFRGRFDYTTTCTIIDPTTWTGSQRVRHCTKARKEANA